MTTDTTSSYSLPAPLRLLTVQQNALTAQLDQQLNMGGSDIQFFENGVQKFVSEDVESMMSYENV